MSYVFCANAAVPPMRRNKGGAIVNVASVRSVVAGGGNLQYDNTKAAVAGLTRALAADHSPDGIRVNALGPGPIFTPYHQRRIAAAGETAEQYSAKAAQGTGTAARLGASRLPRSTPALGMAESPTFLFVHDLTRPITPNLAAVTSGFRAARQIRRANPRRRVRPAINEKSRRCDRPHRMRSRMVRDGRWPVEQRPHVTRGHALIQSEPFAVQFLGRQ